jgi:basic amino acid/polyamine antiporter, APA family
MTDEKLVRGLGRWDLTAIVLNTIIGAGIFGLPSKVYAAIGSYSLIAFVACAVIVALIVLCYAEVASRFSVTGGPYLYAHEALGPVVGFEVGWLFWITRVVAFAANCNLFVTYLGFFVLSATDSVVRAAIIFVIVSFLAVVNLIGVRQSALMTNVVTIGKIVPLALFVAVGIFFIQIDNFHLPPTVGYDSFSAAILLLIYAFVGFEQSVILAGETRNPEKNVPFALLAALAIAAVLYIGIQIVSIGTLPELASSERPLADASARFMGPIGATVLTLGALVSILGNLNVNILSSTRMLFSLGGQKQLPAALALTGKRTKTPYVSILFTSLVIFVFTLQSSFLTAVAISTIARLLVFATTCLALPIFRRSERVPPARFRVPAGVLCAFISLALIAWLLTNADFRKEGLTTLIMAAIGLLIYFAYRAVRKNDAEPES